MPDDSARHHGRSSMTAVTPYDPASVPRQPAVRASRVRASTPAHAIRTTAWVRLEAAVASLRGPKREVNEDWHSTLDGETPLFVVADGVGGGAMAARASRELVSQLHASLGHGRVDAAAIRDALLVADREVRRSIASHTSASGAATVALCAGRGRLLSKWLIGWVGDCRVYRLREGVDEPAELLTVDDTYRQLREIPPPGGSSDDPARMVGNGAVLAPNVGQTVLAPGEMLLLCSDGVHKHLEARELGRVMRGSAPLLRRCRRLLALARAHGSSDDATVLVVRPEPRRARLVGFAAGAILFAVIVAALAATLMVMQ
jgi:PPM family protein phosphatase